MKHIIITLINLITSVSGAEYYFGNVPDKPDKHDKIYSSPRKEILDNVDLREQMSTVEDQRTYPTCTSNAVIGLIEFLQLKNNNTQNMSRMFVYYHAQKLDSKAKGTSIRSALKAIENDGVCPESQWPYIRQNMTHIPNKVAYELAKNNKIINYYRVVSELPRQDEKINQIKTALSEGYPVVFGTTIFKSFMKIKRNGIMKMPSLNEEIIGNHAMVICGYTQTHFIVRNSWGKKWGDNGYLYMPFEYFNKYPYSTWDFWIVKQ